MHKSRCQKIVEISLSKSVDNPSSAQANANVECSNTNIREIHSFDHNDKSTHLFDGRATTRKICEIRNVDWRNEVKTRSGKESQENESILRIDSRYVNCANLKVPSYLLSSETSTSDNDKCFLSSVDFNSDFFGLTATGEDQTRALKEIFPSNEAFEKKIRYPECKPSTSENQEDIENEECSRRNFSFVYHLPLDEQKVRVCKTFFLDTLSISAQTVRTVFNKLGSSGVVSEDKRGKPKKDLCDICHRYENGSTDEKISMGDEYQLHLKNKNLARALKAADKERAKQKTTLCCAVFDLQQVLSVPKSEVGLAYYKLKLSTYNFTVFDLAYKDAFCYMWYQCIGNRGASEIGSCLLLFIEARIRKGVNEFAFYSDNCAGQNRNKYLFSLYNYLSQKYKIKIRHTFLEKGHTQSEGDSVHSVIEKAARNVPVYTPEQWYTLVRTCKRKQPYIVTELGQENIRDLKDLQEKTSMNWEKNDQNERSMEENENS
nr:unnamed protein product [Callosobruchus chinensis]